MGDNFTCVNCDTLFQFTNDIHKELCMDCCNKIFEVE